MWFYQPKGLHVYQVINHALYNYFKLSEPNHWVKKKVVKTPPFAWPLNLFIICNFAKVFICASIYQHITTVTHAYWLSLSCLWFTRNTKHKIQDPRVTLSSYNWMFDPNAWLLCKCSNQSERLIYNLIPESIMLIAAARASSAPSLRQRQEIRRRLYWKWFL